MSRTVVVTVIFIFIAVLAPFLFPWQFSIFVSIAASAFFPPAPLLTGMLLDVLYGGARSVPYFSILGLFLAILAYFVQQFVKTRIMS
jgi:hypothetical protein